MIPFRDANPSYRPPVITVSLILINVIVFFYEVSLGPHAEAFMMDFGVVPKKWSLLGEVADIQASTVVLPYFTSIFLHGGWFHLIGNMWYLWIFGDNVEDRLGHVQFLIFYLLSGLIAGAVHTFFNFHSTLPAVGASGAIAGVLGAYLVSFPHARVQTLVPFFLYYEVIELPAVIVLGFWFVAQLLNGSAAIALTANNAGGVAWWAHIGGFVAGIFLLYILMPINERGRARG